MATLDQTSAGVKVQHIANMLFALGVFISLILGIGVYLVLEPELDQVPAIIAAVLVLALGIYISSLSVSIIRAFGEMAEDIHALRASNKRLATYIDKIDR